MWSNDFEPVYKPIKGKEAIISDLKKSAKAADTVYLATDPDREGEAISWHLKQPAGSAGREDQAGHLQRDHEERGAARASRIPGTSTRIWWMPSRPGVFWTGSWAISSVPCCGRRSSRGLSAGRVQSVATRMVDDREREIENFKPEEYWTLDANLTGQ